MTVLDFRPYRYRGRPGWHPADAGPVPRRYTTSQLCRVRDVPASCTCEWRYRRRPARWVRVQHARGCPWHTS